MAAVQQRHPQTGDDGQGVLEGALAAVARRLRLARWVRHTSRGVLVATAISLVAVLMDHFDLLPDWLSLYAVIVGAFVLGIAAGTATAFGRPIPAMAVARFAETRLGLKERLSSALEFERSAGLSDDPEAVHFRRLQRQDAREYAQKLNAADAVPVALSWETKALVPALVLLALALILPNLPLFLPPGVLTERSIVRKEGVKLEQVAKIIGKQADAQNLPATRHAAQTMQQLARRMAQGRMDKKQAMVRIAQLTKQMQDQQRQLAQQSGQAALGGGKSLSQAGQQLAAALQNPPPGGENGQGGSRSQGATAAGRKSTGAQAGHPGGAHPGAQPANGAHGFNIPAQNKPGDKSTQNPQGFQNGTQTTPEMRQAAQAMQQNDAATLSQQLRQLAQKTENGQLSPTRQQQAAQDLQKLAQSLQGTGMPQTRLHAQAAAQAMARGDKATAAQEMRKAADAAEREAQQREDAQGMQNAQDSLQNGQGEMAGAQDPGDIPDAPPGQSQGNKPGDMPGQGQGPPAGTIPADSRPGNGGHGGGRGKPDTTYHKGQKPKGRLVQKPGVGKDAPHWLDPHFDPTKNPRYAKLYFGKPQTAGPSQSGPTRKTRPGDDAGPVHSAVPYYNTVAVARKTAESTMDREDIPPAYKKNVADYFDSLQPQPPLTPAAGGASRGR